ncbi:MAG: hypothetical protein ACFB20_03730 [Opitutales bacterium]
MKPSDIVALEQSFFAGLPSQSFAWSFAPAYPPVPSNSRQQRVVAGSQHDAGGDHEREDAHQECEHCGIVGAGQFGDRWVCDDCIEGMSSCCPEFGKDDLWTEDPSFTAFR